MSKTAGIHYCIRLEERIEKMEAMATETAQNIVASAKEHAEKAKSEIDALSYAIHFMQGTIMGLEERIARLEDIAANRR